MYNNVIENLIRQKDRIDEMISNYQNQPNNSVVNNPIPSKTLVEWRILNENEEVDNLYVANKTLFISDNRMILKGVDGKLEKWEVKKIYPIDKKDQKISELEQEIKKLKEVINNEHSKPIKSIDEFEQPDGNADGNDKPKPKTNGKYVQKQN